MKKTQKEEFQHDLELWEESGDSDRFVVSCLIMIAELEAKQKQSNAQFAILGAAVAILGFVLIGLQQ